MSETSSSVSLRPFRVDDIGRVLAWRNQPEVARYMYTDHRISEAEHARWFAAAMGDESRRYWIIELDGEPVGVAGLNEISVTQRRAYCASYLALEAHRGHGLGTAAERQLMDHAFLDLGLDKLCTEVLATNSRGVKLHERCGFRIDGVLRQHVLKGGDRIDVVSMSLMRDEWTAGRRATDG